MNGRYCFDQMPSDLQTLWLKEMKRVGRNVSIVLEDLSFEDFFHFISGSFVWKESIQGQDFWSKVAQGDFTVRFSLIEKVVDLLEGTDGEQLEELIKELGMEGQILKQLFFKAPKSVVDELIAEKEALEVHG